MKTTIAILVAICTATTAMATDGAVYFGMLSGDRQRQPYVPASTAPAKYVAGVEVAHNVWRLRPYINIETLMDTAYGSSFDPASVRYQVGVKVRMVDGLHLDVSHSCWHNVDRYGKNETYNQALLRWEFGK